MDHFFNGFCDELIKQAGPIDWIKRKLGGGSEVKAPPPPKPPTNVDAGKKALRQQQKKTYGGAGAESNQRKQLAREGVFGM